MNIKIIKILSLYFLSTGLFAQEGDRRNPEARARMMEKLEAQRVAFITNRLELTPEESSKFWPLYNEYAKKRMEYRKENRRESNPENAEESLDDRFEQEEQTLKLKKNYYEKFKNAIPVAKIAMLDDAEKDFKTEVLKTLKERRRERMK